MLECFGLHVFSAAKKECGGRSFCGGACAWHIPEAVLIPYTELRQRLNEVPRDKPFYTFCRSGFRSYIAYCALKQKGWRDVAFLSGGMMIYHGFHRTPLKVGKGGMPVVEYAEDMLAQRLGALVDV